MQESQPPLGYFLSRGGMVPSSLSAPRCAQSPAAVGGALFCDRAVGTKSDLPS